MNKPTIIITGANGFIGSYLVNYFFAKGWKVRAFVYADPKNKMNGVDYIPYNLEDDLTQSIFESVNYLVHCAYLRFEKNKNADEINRTGTKKLIDICKRKNIKLVFFSSFSAHKNAESHYGKTKLACEKLVNDTTAVILKPGFVIGKKGLAAELIKKIKSSSFFPLIGNGTQPIQTIYIEELCLIVDAVFEKNITGLFYVAEKNAVSMKSFYEEIAKQLNKKIMFIPIPLSLFYSLCKWLERIGLKLPVSSESVLGLKCLITFETERDLNKLGIPLKNYQESLQMVLKQ